MQLRIFATSLLILPSSLLGGETSLAEVSLQQAFKACEKSVYDHTDAPLLKIGTVVSEIQKARQLRFATPHGSVIAVHTKIDRVGSHCVLWGRHPELEEKFAARWQDWVEWEEAEKPSESWFKGAMAVPGSVDLTNNSQPGYVVARCGALENGVVLASQPALAGVFRETLPNEEAPNVPRVFFQFSVIEALPQRCKAAVDRKRNNG